MRPQFISEMEALIEGFDQESEDRAEQTPQDEQHTLYYGPDDVPPWSSAILFGFQQLMVCASGAMTAPLVVADKICAGAIPLARVKIVGTMLFVTGLSTIIQTTFGTRLPLIQSGSFAFIPPIASYMRHRPCQNDSNITDENFEWMSNMNVIQGSMIAASFVQMFIGCTGLIGLLTKFIGPLTIAPLMLLLEVSIVVVCLDYVKQHWISIILIVTLLITALYLNPIKLPVPTYSRAKKCHLIRQPVFALFPYLIAVVITWSLSVLFTVTDVIPPGNKARTDYRADVLVHAPWFRVPYPGQWGSPEISLGLFFGFVAGTIASVIESIGDYHACARISQERVPPSHAVNRGILMEGVCCFIGGFFGGGLGLTTYSENIGVIGITKVASRRTLQIAGLIFMFLGMFTKFGAVVGTLPDPIVGGILTVSMGVVAGVGLSSLQLVDLKLSRNMAVLGIAIILGIIIPDYVEQYPIETGSEGINDILNILLSIKMLVGGSVGFFLDNTVPGASRAQRGLKPLAKTIPTTTTIDSPSLIHKDVYSFATPVNRVLARIPGAKYVPFLPTYE